MKSIWTNAMATALWAGLAAAPALAQEHAAHATPASPAPAMDHGAMTMQGGSPPADARDPDAHADGFERGSGPYALPGVPRLQLADQHRFATLRVQRLERAEGRRGEGAMAYDLQARMGRGFDHGVLKAEGEVAEGRLQDSRTELLWGHAIAAYWDTQLGLRLDHGAGPDRAWLAAGVQGLAPYGIEIDATAYLGQGGRTALRLEADTEVRLTQKWVVQPRTEWNLYGRDDRAKGIGSGLASASFGLRLRYEITPRIAPYLGVEWQRRFGRTAELARAAGEHASQTRWVAGLSFWF